MAAVGLTMEAAGAARTARNEARGSFRTKRDGAVVHRLDRLDVAEEVVGEGILAELVGRMLGIDLPLDGELHRLRR